MADACIRPTSLEHICRHKWTEGYLSISQLNGQRSSQNTLNGSAYHSCCGSQRMELTLLDDCGQRNCLGGTSSLGLNNWWLTQPYSIIEMERNGLCCCLTLMTAPTSLRLNSYERSSRKPCASSLIASSSVSSIGSYKLG